MFGRVCSPLVASMPATWTGLHSSLNSTNTKRCVARKRWATFAFAGWALTASSPVVALGDAMGCPGPEPAGGMATTFSSDFTEATSLDPKQWAPFSGKSLGDPVLEAQTYAPSQVAIAGSAGLRLSIVQHPGQERPFLAGAVTTKDRFSQAYGHFEMMARMPQANGIWPAFWLLPAAGGWPPEIDVIEYIYAPNGVVPADSASAAENWRASNPATTLHWGSISQHQQTAPGVNSPIAQPRTYADWNRTPPPPGWSEKYRGYHIYSVDWRPGSVAWHIDGRAVFCARDTAATGPRVPATPMFMLLNLAVSAGTKSRPLWPGFVDTDTPWPQTMDVAYVRVMQFNDLKTAP